jgi:hypothetical protein
VATEQVPPGQLRTIYLPWIPALKGPDADDCGTEIPITASVKELNGAYHLVSDRPVAAYQFNPIEHTGKGGPPGKDWSMCPPPPQMGPPCGLPCISYTNGASLLLPSTSLTGNYRIAGQLGFELLNMPPYIAITATQDNTSVTVELSATGSVLAGTGIQPANGNGTVSLTLQAGEVAELVGADTSDLSGSLVRADKPVQVITGMQCVRVPEDQAGCDHIEESVFPVETLGRHYFVTMPTGPSGEPVGHAVRLYGNVDGTTLTYPAGAPPNAPASLGAGQVVDLVVVSENFEVMGDHEFGIATFQVGHSLADPGGGNEPKGDPSQSLVAPVEQYRTRYVFAAPTDYDANFLDVVQPLSATVMLDGVELAVTLVEVGSGYGVARVQLGQGNGGAHVLEASAPVGVQVLGYGVQSSYQYAGGLNLEAIAMPPTGN